MTFFLEKSSHSCRAKFTSNFSVLVVLCFVHYPGSHTTHASQSMFLVRALTLHVLCYVDLVSKVPAGVPRPVGFFGNPPPHTHMTVRITELVKV